MSRTAQDLIELLRLAEGGAGALTQHLLRELARSLIAPGAASLPVERGAAVPANV